MSGTQTPKTSPAKPDAVQLNALPSTTDTKEEKDQKEEEKPSGQQSTTKDHSSAKETLSAKQSTLTVKASTFNNHQSETLITQPLEVVAITKQPSPGSLTPRKESFESSNVISINSSISPRQHQGYGGYPQPGQPPPGQPPVYPQGYGQPPAYGQHHTYPPPQYPYPQGQVVPPPVPPPSLGPSSRPISPPLEQDSVTKHRINLAIVASCLFSCLAGTIACLTYLGRNNSQGSEKEPGEDY